MRTREQEREEMISFQRQLIRAMNLTAQASPNTDLNKPYIKDSATGKLLTIKEFYNLYTNLMAILAEERVC